jgi:hypothetical protein
MGESWLSSYDRQLAELREQHPGWRVWFVPFATRKGVCWCAQPEPVINADTAEQLSQAIASVERDRHQPDASQPKDHLLDPWNPAV